jgi:hypothetical protein
MRENLILKYNSDDSYIRLHKSQKIAKEVSTKIRTVFLNIDDIGKAKGLAKDMMDNIHKDDFSVFLANYLDKYKGKKHFSEKDIDKDLS